MRFQPCRLGGTSEVEVHEFEMGAAAEDRGKAQKFGGPEEQIKPNAYLSWHKGQRVYVEREN